jgi:hypothetical protein
MVLHIQSRDRPRRTRGAVVEVCVLFLVCILQVVVPPEERVVEVRVSETETVYTQRTMAVAAALEAVLVAAPGLAETVTKASSSFVYRSAKILAVQ